MTAGLATVGPVERALALRSLPLFRGLPARQIALLAQLAREYGAPRNTVLHIAGQPVRAVYLLIEGRLRQLRDGTVLAPLEAPGALGLMEVLSGEAARTSAIAETDVTALVIDTAALLDVLEDHFPLLLHLCGVFGGQITDLETQLGWYETVTADPSGMPADPPPDGLDLVDSLMHLQRVADLRPLGVVVLAGLLRDAQSLRLEAGGELFAAGARAERLIVLVRGEVTCTPAAPHRPFRIGPGQILGRDAALAGLPYSYRAVARTAVVAIGIDARVFWDLAEDHFHVGLAALAMGARRVLQLEDRRAANHTHNDEVAPRARGVLQ
jgi:CRP-like cAMP-binding protein